jgi:hypothetical protein
MRLELGIAVVRQQVPFLLAVSCLLRISFIGVDSVDRYVVQITSTVNVPPDTVQQASLIAVT